MAMSHWYWARAQRHPAVSYSPSFQTRCFTIDRGGGPELEARGASRAEALAAEHASLLDSVIAPGSFAVRQLNAEGALDDAISAMREGLPARLGASSRPVWSRG